MALGISDVIRDIEHGTPIEVILDIVGSTPS
jgi:hypothetical protein